MKRPAVTTILACAALVAPAAGLAAREIAEKQARRALRMPARHPERVVVLSHRRRWDTLATRADLWPGREYVAEIEADMRRGGDLP